MGLIYNHAFRKGCDVNPGSFHGSVRLTLLMRIICSFHLACVRVNYVVAAGPSPLYYVKTCQSSSVFLGHPGSIWPRPGYTPLIFGKPMITELKLKPRLNCTFPRKRVRFLGCHEILFPDVALIRKQ